jgi:hypothetical protein
MGAREWAIAQGVIRPPTPWTAGELTPLPWLSVPTLRLDEVGRREATRHVRQGPMADSPTHYNAARFARGGSVRDDER